MGRAGSRPEAVPLYATERNPSRETTGGRIAAVSRRMGLPFMPWQSDAADLEHEVDPATGGPWYTTIIEVLLRQTGKTVKLRAELTDTCLYVPHATVRYTAQNRTMALQRLESDIWAPINGSPLRSFLDSRMGRRTGKPGLSGKGGQEHVGFVNGAGLWIDSVKSTSGHGPTLDKGAIDEAFAHQDARIEQAMTPAMATVAHAQLFIASAAGDHTSTYLRERVEAARARVELDATKPLHERTSRTAYIEYAAPEGSDRADPATWWAYHPALGYTITEAKISAALESFESSPEDFDRAYLGWWPKAKAPDPVVPSLTWRDSALAAEEVDWQGEPAWCVDVSPDRDWSAIGYAAAHPPARAWVEVVAHEQGTHWVVRHLVKLRADFGGNHVAVDGSGAAAALVPDLEAEGFVVHRLSLRDKVDACGAFYDDALSDRIRHGADPVLTSALMTAVKRYTGDAWVFWRGKSLSDITPLYAVTLARFVLVRLLGDDYDVLKSTL